VFQKLKAFWSSLPHQVQAAVIVGASAFGESIEHVIEIGQLPHSLLDAKHLLGRAFVAAVVAAWAFYRLPNGTAQLVAQAKAQNAADARSTTPPANGANPPQPVTPQQ
jgi:hypothetical protein